MTDTLPSFLAAATIWSQSAEVPAAGAAVGPAAAVAAGAEVGAGAGAAGVQAASNKVSTALTPTMRCFMAGTPVGRTTYDRDWIGSRRACQSRSGPIRARP